MSNERTLKPTPRRRQQMRAAGFVAASPALVGAAVWLAASIMLCKAAPQNLRRLGELFEQTWQTPWIGDSSASVTFGLSQLHSGSLVLATTVGPLALLTLSVASIVRFAQVGWLWIPHRIVPDWNRMGNQPSIVRVFSVHSLLQMMIWLILAVSLISLFGMRVFRQREDIVRVGWSHSDSRDLWGMAIADYLGHWGIWLGLVMFLWGTVDYALQRYRYEKNLKMTPAEWRSEVQAVRQRSGPSRG